MSEQSGKVPLWGHLLSFLFCFPGRKDLSCALENIWISEAELYLNSMTMLYWIGDMEVIFLALHVNHDLPYQVFISKRSYGVSQANPCFKFVLEIFLFLKLLNLDWMFWMMQVYIPFYAVWSQLPLSVLQWSTTGPQPSLPTSSLLCMIFMQLRLADLSMATHPDSIPSIKPSTWEALASTFKPHSQCNNSSSLLQ